MELGQRIAAARKELGLSQRQLCGDVITRNMLSQIENGSAKPSMDTLRYLAQRLGKSVSYFLEEDAVTSPNQSIMAQARDAYAAGEYGKALDYLRDYRAGDSTFDWEKDLLSALSCLTLARQALKENRIPYAKHLLEQMPMDTPYVHGGLRLERSLLFAQLSPDEGEELPDLTQLLLMKSRNALSKGELAQASAYLQAADDKTLEEWNMLQGDVSMAKGELALAVQCYHVVERKNPEMVYAKLEQCYMGLEDYKNAYLYACKQKK